MASSIPLCSHEVRWFFDGEAEAHAALKRWFEGCSPLKKAAGVGAPAWKGRLDDEPDRYLLLPGGEGMGIKWREGELQVKGRTERLGTQIFAARHHGVVERWVKWSYRELPDAYRQIFTTRGAMTVAVSKTRAQRKLRLDSMTGKAEEVAVGTFIDRGGAMELTNLMVGEKSYCSLAFEVFPNDSGVHAAFTQTVDAFLAELYDVTLSAATSMSYPAWLAEVTS